LHAILGLPFRKLNFCKFGVGRSLDRSNGAASRAVASSASAEDSRAANASRCWRRVSIGFLVLKNENAMLES
jgi:hypothetical protein